MSHMKICFDNKAKNAAITATASYTGLVASNMLDDTPTSIYRSTTTSTSITTTWSSPVEVSLVAVAFTNLSSAATVVFSLYSDIEGTNLLDWDYPVINAAGPSGKVCSQTWFDSVMVRRVDVEVSGNAANVEIGSLIIGPAHTFSYNPAYGATLTWRDESRVTRTENANVRVEPGPIYRVAQLNFSALKPSDSLALRKLAKTGKGRVGFISMFPGSSDSYEQDWTFVACINGDHSEAMNFISTSSTSITFEEVL